MPRTRAALPEAIKGYFDAQNEHDIDGMLACFAPSAVVKDAEYEDELRGSKSIRRWMKDTTQKYDLTVAVRDWHEADGETVLTARVSGDFPGSPADLHYTFALVGEKVSRLRITT